MSNDLAVQPAIVIFDKGRAEACGVAPVGVADPTFFAPVTKVQREAGGVRGVAVNDAGQMVDAAGTVGGVPVSAEVDPITGGIAFDTTGESALMGSFAKALVAIVAKGQRYGVSGNGVDDDTAGLRLAIKAAFDTGASELFIPPGDYRVSGGLLTLLPENTTVRFRIRGAGSSYGGTRIVCGGSNYTAFKVSCAGLNISDLSVIGDGATYGAGATVKAVEAIGARVGNQWNLDMRIDRCLFVYLAACIEQTGKNLNIGPGCLFSNSLLGVSASKQLEAEETRGLSIESGVRFHSIGGQYVPAKAIYLDPSANFLDVTIGQIYCDDCYSIIEGFAAPLQINAVLGSRNWGGINLDTTGRTINEYGKNVIDFGNIILHFVTDTSGRRVDGFALKNTLDIRGSIGQIDIFNPSGRCATFESSPGKVARINVSSLNASDPGSGGAYDCVKIGNEVGGLKLSKAILSKGGSTTTGVALRKVGVRSAAWSNEIANVFGPEIAVYGFAAANRFALADPRDYGPPKLMANDFSIQTVVLDQNFSIVTGVNNAIVKLTSAITANRNLNVSDVNVYDGASFRVIYAGASANTWAIIANGGATLATLSTDQFVDIIYSAAADDWVVVSKGVIA